MSKIMLQEPLMVGLSGVGFEQLYVANPAPKRVRYELRLGDRLITSLPCIWVPLELIQALVRILLCQESLWRVPFRIDQTVISGVLATSSSPENCSLALSVDWSYLRQSRAELGGVVLMSRAECTSLTQWLMRVYLQLPG
jgi:hypothetical protein